MDILPRLSVSDCTSHMPLCVAPTLTDLPVELLVHVLSYLDVRSVLYLRVVCRRLHTLTDDPMNWSTVCFWKADSRLNDARGLKLALRLSNDVLKCLSLLGCNSWHLTTCINPILSCHHLRSISFKNVVYTEKNITKILGLPELTYLHLDEMGVSLLEVIIAQGKHLETLSTSLKGSNIYALIDVWSKGGYIPPDLRIASESRVSINYIMSSLPPSTNHSSYLSVYHCTALEIVPIHPYLQFHFTPNPTLHTLQSMGLFLTADTPGSNKFSAAHCNNQHHKDTENLIIEIAIHDVRDTLTQLQLTYASFLTSGMLAELTGVLPGLVHLDISGCDVLSDLGCLAAVSANCPRLKVLSLLEIWRAESLEKLWRILATMVNLRILSIPAFLLPTTSDPIPTPCLTAIRIHGRRFSPHHNTELVLAFLGQMSSLEIFWFQDVPPVTVFRGFSNLLCSCPNLTHLYISKRPGNKLTLPTDPSCYWNLEQFHLYCEDFVFRDDLAHALAQSKKLCVLFVEVSSFDIKGIIDLVTSCRLLSVFHICVLVWAYQRPKKFEKAVKETAKKEGRILDFEVRVKTPRVGSAQVWW